MERVQCQDKPLNLHLNYFPSSKPSSKTGQYSVSSGLAGEIESHNRKVKQLFLDCDCACQGRK